MIELTTLGFSPCYTLVSIVSYHIINGHVVEQNVAFCFMVSVAAIDGPHHRLRGSASPVLTATLHSYGSLA